MKRINMPQKPFLEKKISFKINYCFLEQIRCEALCTSEKS